jgi:hypothetical protein
MKIFKELKKLGYKHYTEHTVEELDNLPLESKERIMEQALVLRWFREKHQLKCCIIPLVCGRGYSDLYESRIHQEKHSVSIIGNYKIYEEAELASLFALIKIVKKQNFNS